MATASCGLRRRTPTSASFGLGSPKLARGLLIWLLIMLVETIHGVLRGALLAPLVGAAAAERMGWPMAALMVLAIATLSIRWIGIVAPRGLLRLGAAWAALTVLFEVLVGLLRGIGGEGLLAALDPLQGSIPWSAVLMLLAPLIAAQLRGHR